MLPGIMSLSIVNTADQRIYDPPQRMLGQPRRAQARRMVRSNAPSPILTPAHTPQGIRRRTYPTDCCCGAVDSVAGPPVWLGQQGPAGHLPTPPLKPQDPRWWRGWVRWLLGI